MEQLTIGDLVALVQRLMKQGMTMQEICALPIYLGDDDELNGIHCGWALDVVDANDTENDNLYLVKLINEDRGNIKLEKGKAILIS